MPVLPDVVPPLNLTAAYRSPWCARFRQGSSISLIKVAAALRRGSIFHTGRSFDWNNPSMNCLYHRSFLYPVPYVHKVGNRGKNQKFPRLWKWYGIMGLTAAASRRKGCVRRERCYYNSGKTLGATQG
ncbi:hypothetical protein D7X87_20295 [bacterium D16-54]|nr:hypothetical protein D7X87_20295 [bacterium D16-54]RKJ11740.1 hypothetical protein D7X65_20735 [bacterium D16-56]